MQSGGSLGHIPDCACPSFSDSPMLLTSTLLHSGQTYDSSSLFLFKTNSPAQHEFSERKRNHGQGALYTSGSWCPAPTQWNLPPHSAQQWEPWLSPWWEPPRESALRYKLPTAPTPVCGIFMDSFRCFQLCHVVSHVLPLTGTIEYSSHCLLVEHLRLFPSPGQSGGVKNVHLQT